MDQWPSKFSECFGLDRYWSIECSSLFSLEKNNQRFRKGVGDKQTPRKSQKNSPEMCPPSPKPGPPGPGVKKVRKELKTSFKKSRTSQFLIRL